MWLGDGSDLLSCSESGCISLATSPAALVIRIFILFAADAPQVPAGRQGALPPTALPSPNCESSGSSLWRRPRAPLRSKAATPAAGQPNQPASAPRTLRSSQSSCRCHPMALNPGGRTAVVAGRLRMVVCCCHVSPRPRSVRCQYSIPGPRSIHNCNHTAVGNMGATTLPSPFVLHHNYSLSIK